MIELAPSVAGGLVGFLGGIGNGIIELFKHKQETARLREQWQHEREMAKINADIATEHEAAKAFTASVASGHEAGWTMPPAGTPWWLSIAVVYSEALRRFTRPGLTWVLTLMAYYNPAMEPQAGIAIGWWFGTRTSTKFFSK
jgi:hypothetical protein